MPETRKRIPIGIDDYRKLVTGGYYYVDKTLLVRDIIEDGRQVMLFTRPRRFGKSLNLSMLNYFFNVDGSGKGLFDDCQLARSDNPHTDEQGKYPVIAISLKEMKQSSYEQTVKQFLIICKECFLKFEYLLDSPRISQRLKDKFTHLLDTCEDPLELASGFRLLTQALHDHHGQGTVILIDEYDVPLNSGYVSGYYDDILNIIRTMLSSFCKDNPYLRLAVHTGCLRLAGESMYTGFNNLYINTILNRDFNAAFGFTPDEVQNMLDHYSLGDQMPAVKEWYDGYLFGGQDIYNPWSILHFVKIGRSDPQNAIGPYWANTSENALLMKFIDCSLDGNSSRNDLERLLDDVPVTHVISETISFSRFRLDKDSIWNILFFAGYLKPCKEARRVNGRFTIPLVLVNREIHSILEDNLEVWYQQLSAMGRTVPLIRALEAGNPIGVEAELNDFLMRTVSFRDRAENFYHGFIAGLLSNPAEYECRSNRESGNGVSDIRLERRDRRAGTILEIKMASTANELDKMAETALDQAVNRRYAQELAARQFVNIHVYGIACFEKQCRVRMLEL